MRKMLGVSRNQFLPKNPKEKTGFINCVGSKGTGRNVIIRGPLVFAVCLIVFMPGPLFAQESPEIAVKAFISAIAEGELDRALEVCSADDYATGLDFEGYTYHLRAFTAFGPAPGTSDLYRQINRYERIGAMVRQIKYFCFGFSDNPDAGAISEGRTAPVEDSASITRFCKDTDSAKLKGLKVRKFKLFRPEPGTQLKLNWDRQAKLYGAMEMLDGIALLELNGRTYGLALEFLRYKSGWKIFSLNSPILNSNVFGVAPAMTEEEFDSIDDEMKYILTAPASQ